MQRLSSFAQAASRQYTQAVYCFPYDYYTSKKATTEHLRSSIQRLEEQFPLLAGTLHMSPEEGIVSVRPGGGKIPFQVFITGGQQLAPTDDLTYFDCYYSLLASRGFPPQAFVQDFLKLDGELGLGKGPVPVSHVRATFIPEGLLIWLSIHHTVADDHCLGLFAGCFAAATRREPIPSGTPMSPVLNLPKDPVWAPATLMTLGRACPEFDILLYPGESPSLPDALPGGLPLSEIPKTGKIFIFRLDRLEHLRSLIYNASDPEAEPPSIDACLTALTMAYVTQARLETESGSAPEDDNPYTAKLVTPVNWRDCVGRGVAADYFGNAVITLLTRIPLGEVKDACADGTMAAMARLVAKISASVATVDEEAVLKRDALFHRVGDTRRLLLRVDSRRPADLEFSSWRRTLGADTPWNIPGVLSGRPDAIRRVRGDWNIGNALVLPARLNSRVYELQLSLPKVSMDALCQNEGWMAWVDKVVG
ncbi:hypothetical protein VPNG_02582 [Cytospora leucostoma]|uniref:Condensation domain-containing protein n=1 Tax=Cytospora leucostoma TaxID=1230097 RepID=A0A423XIT3_9PEZI|nr:hypothetical protein VPNG_02582 [Cytospora leucostoma]